VGDHEGVSHGAEQVDVLENGTGPRWWETVPLPVRRAGAVLVVVLLVVAGILWVRDRAADRERAERIDLVTSLALESSSTSPPGGRVSYFVVVRNEGLRPVSVTGIGGGADGLRLRMRDDAEPMIPVGGELSIPLSIRLTCADTASGPLTAELAIRRADGGPASREVDLEPASLVLDVAGTLCAVRPDLRDHELSGPVLRGVAAKADTGD
jgi:hypothetical protein